MTDPPVARLTTALADRYRIERELGAGGMAVVYLAHDLKHDRRVAIKVLHPELAATLGADRFLREIRVTANLQHPHILPLFDSGAADGLLFYVMPYVEGESLRSRLVRDGELAVDEGLEMLREIADALAYAHARGIVHRDIKPENILLSGRHVLVADFGVAKAMRAAAGVTALTGTGMTLGTPTYMAPEQAMGEPAVNHLADIYTFGVLAYEIFAGAPPFSGVTGQQLLAAHLTRQAEPLSKVRPGVSGPIEQLVMRCLEKRPADRWRTAEDLLHRLNALVSGPMTVVTDPNQSRPPVDGVFVLDENVCRKMNRAALDARVIGGEMQYSDNGRDSSVLVCYLHAVGGDQRQFEPMVRASPYRAVAPTAFGFEPRARRRISLSIDDHIVVTREFIRDATLRLAPSTVVLVGISSGADFGLRLLGSEPPIAGIDGYVSLGCNVNLETCFVTRTLAQMTAADERGVLAHLRSIGAAAETLESWLTLHEYFVTMFRKFSRDMDVLQRYGADIVRPFEAGGESPFVEWYRRASARVGSLRCVFEDAEPYNTIIAALRLRHLDDGILGTHHRRGSIVTEPGTNHFDLMQPDRVAGHVEAVLAALRDR